MAAAQCFCSFLPVSTRTVFSSSRRRLGARACSADSPTAFETNPVDAPAVENLPTSLVSRTPQLDSLEGTAGVLKVNHYSVLRVPIGASTSQIAQAFKERCEEVMQNRAVDDEASKAELRALQASFETLSTTEERRVYDWALQRYENREGGYIWPYETDITQKYTGKDTPAVMRSFDEEGNNKVAAFLLGWLAISVLFSVTMKTWIPYDFSP